MAGRELYQYWWTARTTKRIGFALEQEQWMYDVELWRTALMRLGRGEQVARLGEMEEVQDTFQVLLAS